MSPITKLTISFHSPLAIDAYICSYKASFQILANLSMMESPNKPINVSDETANRKDKHLDLALQSQNNQVDDRFYYEPMLSAHPADDETWEVEIGDKKMRFPIWISSMTGGTEKTNEVNKRLAITAGKYGLGMGVGSARIALEDNSKAEGFMLRRYLGDDLPLYINFGIAQIEESLKKKEIEKLVLLKDKIGADGFIIHVNPLQEWMQPEGDRFQVPPIETIRQFMEETKGTSLIVKEVGQGFGYDSMKALLRLPLTAIDFAAAGGTNFSKVELLRNKVKSQFMMPFVGVGQTAEEMVDILNKLIHILGPEQKCESVIVSGGVQNFLDGFYYIQKAEMKAVYGQASAFLRQALVSQEALDEFAEYQTKGLLLARAFLRLKDRQ